MQEGHSPAVIKILEQLSEHLTSQFDFGNVDIVDRFSRDDVRVGEGVHETVMVAQDISVVQPSSWAIGDDLKHCGTDGKIA